MIYDYRDNAPRVDFDEYNTVINGEQTYEAIAYHLHQTGSIVIAWTEDQGSQMDILFCLRPFQAGHLNRGLRGDTDLFVGVFGFGLFGFDIHSNLDLHPGYINEKLQMGGVNVTVEGIAELITGVRGKL